MSQPSGGVIDPFGMYRRKGGVFANGFCSAAHPTDKYTWCRRRPLHDGAHAAFTFSIREPEFWRDEIDA